MKTKKILKKIIKEVAEKSLTSVRIPKWIESIVDNAFFNCSSVRIPKNVTSIKYDGFSGCWSFIIY
jgi:hypothetical protein